MKIQYGHILTLVALGVATQGSSIEDALVIFLVSNLNLLFEIIFNHFFLKILGWIAKCMGFP